ncbi:H-type small acid-soluble spore protein [Ornithinibacillus halotolerans]|uniref:Small, acid-soluble spore protein H n=1 Tax=Ornithinibacillus halotolerans TaxID=1274357 RepID=A0A916S975_9BACI|nr:H-type small acid-soluble spore protein [Ornithinibacillus halotolerans]GGA89529.1 small, acid-soluble spore protein H [Ornithinibacillus halotolerans]
MDLHRAEQIINSDVFVNVHYHGIPVYIQKVNEDKAQIFPLDAMNQEQEVDLKGLNETGPIFI